MLIINYQSVTIFKQKNKIIIIEQIFYETYTYNTCTVLVLYFNEFVCYKKMLK